MERIVKYLEQDPPALRPALARFRELAKERLAEWELRDIGESADDCIQQLQNGSPPSTAELEAAPLSWLKAVDQELFDTATPGECSPGTPVLDGDNEHWVVRRTRPGTGFNARRGKPGHYTPWHHVLSACIEGIPTQVRSVPHDTARACTRIVDNNAFKVAIARFEDGAGETFRKFDATKHFRMEALNTPQARLQSALDALTKACDEQVDCLIFPELTFTRGIAQAFAEHLFDASLEPASNLPPLVVIGSYHEATHTIDKPHTRNRALLLAHDGSQLMCHDKRSKVLFKFEPDGPDWEEALAPCETPYELLPLDAGLVGLAICKDLFDGPVSKLLYDLDLDWLLVPSMSDKLTEHQTKTGQLRKQSGTVSIVANQAMPGHTSGTPYPCGYVQQGPKPDPCTNPLTIVSIPLAAHRLRLVKG